MIDLQCHTTASDGELSPEELVNLAVKKGLRAIAITDHDSLTSVKRAMDHAQDKLEVVPGIELSCDDPLFHYDKIDVLGLLIDPENKPLIELTEHINHRRDENKREVIAKLNKLGYELSFDQVKKTAKGTFGRPHIAKALVKTYPQEFSSVREAFDKMIGRGKPAFVETNHRVSIEDGVKTIKNSGGVAILAHPGIYPKEDAVKLINYFIEKGGDGIETYYPYHLICPELKLDESGNEKYNQFFRDIAKEKKVLESGGNDHHGAYRETLGVIKIPDEVLKSLKERIPCS